MQEFPGKAFDDHLLRGSDPDGRPEPVEDIHFGDEIAAGWIAAIRAEVYKAVENYAASGRTEADPLDIMQRAVERVTEDLPSVLAHIENVRSHTCSDADGVRDVCATCGAYLA